MSQDFSWLQSRWIPIIGWFKSIQLELRTYLNEVLEHLLLFLIFYIILCLLLYLLIMQWKLLSFRKDVKVTPKRVLFVIAHPDDECMFFGPTVLNFTRRPGCLVYLMCLSTGKNYGMGTIRKRELYAACKVLGIKEECIIVQNHSYLPDSMSVKWPAEIAAQLILHQVALYDIDTLITFDKHGISRHLNHCSLYFAVAHLSTTKQLPNSCNVYVLESVNIVRKYWLLLDIPISYILSRIRYIATNTDRCLLKRAMQQHQSQYVWFRKLFLRFSRYQMINTLQKMDRQDIELDLELDDD
ncbi:PREDICTED: N-acetylglucosaminyl-phosphatidylinositol de-N-acetylase [Nicrophorus vespilloides]|uniref:N-acetylglucosaminylphosphatidylinositol deacetylase n=1 Tax=Nicrophorus vespilloides TaxID=110193 RepID=A0ABM1N554_NICVS|nr:PREDICTED: N-acetylglucosaminyl-phosphatidylinositol de-N-acetylase [Nicrophorus vespilloides]